MNDTIFYNGRYVSRAAYNRELERQANEQKSFKEEVTMKTFTLKETDHTHALVDVVECGDGIELSLASVAAISNALRRLEELDSEAAHLRQKIAEANRWQR